MSKHKLIAERGAPVIPSDTTDIISIADPTVYSGGSLLFVGTGGDVKVRTQGGDDVTFAGVADGSFLPVVVVRVFDTGTSASNLVSMPRDIGDKPVSASAPTFASIFGANYYEDWDFNDLSTISQSGSGLIDSITSKGTNGGVFTSTGSRRPTSVLNATLGKNIGFFDGVSEFMQVIGSEADYNFIHENKGYILIIGRFTNVPTTSAVWLFSNNVSTSAYGFNITVLSSGKYRTQINTALVTTDAECGFTAGTLLGDFFSMENFYDIDNPTRALKNFVNVNNILKGSNAQAAASSIGDPSYPITLGGTSSSGGLNFGGEIARILIIDEIPTTEQLAQVQELLTSEYGTFPIS